jgi:hypothetical protein
MPSRYYPHMEVHRTVIQGTVTLIEYIPILLTPKTGAGRESATSLKQEEIDRSAPCNFYRLNTSNAKTSEHLLKKKKIALYEWKENKNSKIRPFFDEWEGLTTQLADEDSTEFMISNKKHDPEKYIVMRPTKHCWPITDPIAPFEAFYWRVSLLNLNRKILLQGMILPFRYKADDSTSFIDKDQLKHPYKTLLEKFSFIKNKKLKENQKVSSEEQNYLKKELENKKLLFFIEIRRNGPKIEQVEIIINGVHEVKNAD